ncbi:pantetheine-phosphate adenylyltransferase [Parvibaculum sp.]|uniref:pantetheine-phosphate adenylyltransferase n=1 Tax=Parvibaculum sp. TaxID=2024848 RepID=UPI00272EF6CD|nr:pantetheine-phosphate adenylyltransferase [Parvibaculum sp.]MDP1628109.1 pantetheine-phosphate adenylyltransferase [Parvibaculum sp.]MDP2151108.1 pantetheine-phosphate adenylyltransferase [Parvibaculum sp.]MDP3328575.1 pantetheine-phosphate adenylyltransferase [Parvibaculum sp.]
MARIGLYPGTFDPMTNGHLDIIRRGLKLVDHLIVAIGVNATKTPLLTLEERFQLIEQEAGPIAKELGSKISTASFSGLVVNAADEHGATVIVRGLRGAVDFEYETQMVGMNRVMNPHVETVFLAASPETQFISSTLVRQIAAMDGDISPFVPPHVKDKVLARVAEQKKSR